MSKSSFTNVLPIHLDTMIYLIHYTPLRDRKQNLLNEMKSRFFNYAFIEKYDRECLTINDLAKFDTDKLRLSQISCSLKHLYALELIRHSRYKYNLVLEDDVVLDKKFTLKLERGLKQLPKDYDMLFIGNGCGMHIPSSRIKPNKYIYYKGRYATRWGGMGATKCTDSILISPTCAQRIYEYYQNVKEHEIQTPIGWWFNKVIQILKLNVYWMEPTIVQQGTETGLYDSSTTPV